MKSANSVCALAFIVILVVGLVAAAGLHVSSPGWCTYLVVEATVFVAFIVSSSIQVADQWAKAVVLLVDRTHHGNRTGRLRDHASARVASRTYADERLIGYKRH